MARCPEPRVEAARAALADPLAYRPRDAAAAIGVSEALLYELISVGALPARKLRGATIILRSDLVAFLEALPLTASAAKARASPG
jgi:putative heme degradation protein